MSTPSATAPATEVVALPAAPAAPATTPVATPATAVPADPVVPPSPEVVVVTKTADAATPAKDPKASELDAKLKVAGVEADMKIKKATAAPVEKVHVVDAIPLVAPAVVLVAAEPTKEPLFKAEVHVGVADVTLATSAPSPSPASIVVVKDPTPAPPAPAVVVFASSSTASTVTVPPTVISRSLHPRSSLIVEAGAVVFAESNSLFKDVLVMRKFPKGKQAIDEELPHTAVRKVYEETGIHINLVSHFESRPREHHHLVVEKFMVDRKEPFACERRTLEDGTLHLIYWFVGAVADGERATSWERNDGLFVRYKDMVSLATTDHREIVEAALEALDGHDGKHCCMM